MPSVSRQRSFFELFACEVAIGISAADDVVEIVFLPGLGRAHGDDLLHEDVEGRRRDFESVEVAGFHGADERGLFDEVVAGGGEEAAFRCCAAPVTGATDTLHGSADGARGVDLADEIDSADVDAKFERGGGDEELDFSGLETALGFVAQLARERAVMGGDVLRADAFADDVGEALDHAAGVDEDEGGSVFEREFGEAIVDGIPDGVRGDGAEFVRGEFDGEVEGAACADLDDGEVGSADRFAMTYLIGSPPHRTKTVRRGPRFAAGDGAPGFVAALEVPVADQEVAYQLDGVLRGG